VDVARLRPFGVLDQLDDGQLARLAESVDEVEVETGKELVRAGDFGYHLFLIEEGEAEVLRDGQIVAGLGPGAYFGEIAILVTGTRTATVRARTPMRLLVVFDRALREIRAEAPEIGDALRAGMAERMPGATTG
jgi:CRP-like cAMP-binding protein